MRTVRLMTAQAIVRFLTDGGAFWQVGVPEVTERPAVDEARARRSEGRSGQRVGW